MPDTAAFTPDRATDPIWKVDRFIVPEAEMPAFRAILNDTHRLLETLDGFLWQAVLLQEGGDPGHQAVITAVAWRDEAAIAAARGRVRAWQGERGFEPARYVAEHGIEAEFGLYRGVPALCSVR